MRKHNERIEMENMQKQHEEAANLSPNDKMSGSPSPLKRVSASYEEGYQNIGADTGGTSEK